MVRRQRQMCLRDSLSAVYAVVPGFGAIDFQKIVVLSRTIFWSSYQSLESPTVRSPNPVWIPDVLIALRVSAALIEASESPSLYAIAVVTPALVVLETIFRSNSVSGQEEEGGTPVTRN